MFALTFLGHQGWLVETATTNVLIDPLLGDRFGHGGLLGEVYPPRVLDLDQLPIIDAVIISHEHDDHFDLPSLARLDRRIPIYLSSRSSIAARELLAQMGFARVEPLEPDTLIEIGELGVQTFCAAHHGREQADEWDVFPMLIYDRGGHGSMFSSIDVRPRDADLQRLRELVPRPGIWAYANNCSRASFQDLSRPDRSQDDPAPAFSDSDDTPLLARAVQRRYALLESGWGPPVATLICGAGWSFDRERAWMNHHLFPIDSGRLASALAELTGAQQPMYAPIPGQGHVMRDAAIVSTHTHRSFIRTRAPELWPAREHRGEGPRLLDYAPACGRTRVGAGGRDALTHELIDFARYLYGTPLFCELHSLPTTLASGASARPCLSLRDDDGGFVLAYEPSACSFVPHPSADPTQEFAAGLECWASDLLALLRGELGVSALCYAGRLRVWNHSPSQLRISARELWDFGHPLRRPDRAARLYQHLLAAQPDAAPSVRARGSS